MRRGCLQPCTTASDVFTPSTSENEGVVNTTFSGTHGPFGWNNKPGASGPVPHSRYVNRGSAIWYALLYLEIGRQSSRVRRFRDFPPSCALCLSFTLSYSDMHTRITSLTHFLFHSLTTPPSMTCICLYVSRTVDLTKAQSQVRAWVWCHWWA